MANTIRISSLRIKIAGIGILLFSLTLIIVLAVTNPHILPALSIVFILWLICLYIITMFEDVYLTSDGQILIKNFTGKLIVQCSTERIEESYSQYIRNEIRTVIIKKRKYHFHLDYRLLDAEDIFSFDEVKKLL